MFNVFNKLSSNIPFALSLNLGVFSIQLYQSPASA